MARKIRSDYQKEEMKDDCDTLKNLNKEEKFFVKNFEPELDLSIYHDDHDVDVKKEKSFNSFKSKSDVPIYYGDLTIYHHTNDFGSKSYATIYHDDDLSLKQEKTFVNDFETSSDASIYQG